MRWAVAAVAGLAAVTGACGGSADREPQTVTVAGDRVPVASLVDGHTALCEASASAATDPAGARAAFLDRAHDALHTVARGLEDRDRAGAGQLLQAKEKVESGLETRPPTLAADIARLAESYRGGLGRLAIAAPPCD